MNDLLIAEMNKLLREDAESLLRKEKSYFDDLTSPYHSSLVLFGAGELGRKTLAGLRNAGIEPLAFSDNNRSLWGSTIDGVQVLSPELAAAQFGNKASFVVTIWRAGGGHRFATTRQQLLDLHCSKIVSFATLFWKFGEFYLPYYALGLPHTLITQANDIKSTFKLWSDYASRAEYISQLRLRFLLDFDGLASPDVHDQYFPDDLYKLKKNEVFVDCGAFDGDTLQSLLEVHLRSFEGEIIALEPDPSNLEKLHHYVGQLHEDLRNRVRILPFAVGAHRQVVHFSATGTAAAVVSQSGSLRIDCVPLDDILMESAPTFIKMDIEGAELDALAGAINVIKKHTPIIAVSVYHQPDHLWKIPQFISSLSSEYRFFLRPHNEEGWDLVCYAVPVKRLEVMGIITR